MNSKMTEYLKHTEIIDYNHPTVKEFVKKGIAGSESERNKAVCLYYLVRDIIRYDPYRIGLSVEGLQASTTLKTGRGWCVTKASLLAAFCRLQSIPAKLGFVDVKNHLSTERMCGLMKTDIFT